MWLYLQVKLNDALRAYVAYISLLVWHVHHICFSKMYLSRNVAF